MDLFSELTGLMAKYSFSPNRKLGQHFIISEEILQRIIKEAELKKTDSVLEIGSGTGFLTREIQKQCNVKAFEIDENLCELLKQELGEKNLEIECGDFLEAELPKFNKVVSLPPYSISAKIMQRLFDCEFDLGLIVFQREFVQKLVAFPGFEEYNANSVLTQYYYALTIVCKVSKNSFFPKPESDSVLLKLESKKRFGKAKDEKLFQRFVREIFRYGNKNIEKALKLSFPFLKKELGTSEKDFLKKIENIKIKEKKVNVLEVEDIVQIFNGLF